MKEIFLKIITENEMLLLARFILLPLITIIVYYIFLLIYVRLDIFRSKGVIEDYLLKVQFSKMYSINSLIVLLNGYWFYLLYNNSISTLNWDFTFEITNIYLQLAPFVIVNILLIILYAETKKTILKII